MPEDRTDVSHTGYRDRRTRFPFDADLPDYDQARLEKCGGVNGGRPETRGIAATRFAICPAAGYAKQRSRNKWRKLPAGDAMIFRKLKTYATEKPDWDFSNGPKARENYSWGTFPTRPVTNAATKRRTPGN